MFGTIKRQPLLISSSFDFSRRTLCVTARDGRYEFLNNTCDVWQKSVFKLKLFVVVVH